MGTRRKPLLRPGPVLGLVAALAACQMDYSGSVMGTSRELHLKYTAFNTTERRPWTWKPGMRSPSPWSARRRGVHRHPEGGGPAIYQGRT